MRTGLMGKTGGQKEWANCGQKGRAATANFIIIESTLLSKSQVYYSITSTLFLIPLPLPKSKSRSKWRFLLHLLRDFGTNFIFIERSLLLRSGVYLNYTSNSFAILVFIIFSILRLRHCNRFIITLLSVIYYLLWP